MDLADFCRAALDEDLGPGDLTTYATVPAGASGIGRIRAKEPLRFCGHEVAQAVFAEVGRRLSCSVLYEAMHPDGASLGVGDVAAEVEGDLSALLVGERTALNCLMKLSGIATHVGAYVDAAFGPGGVGPKVLDTRKTTPLWRALEKYAVRVGGAHNHRFGLYDGVLVKDNHIEAAGGITAAVRAARATAHHLAKVEVEVRNAAELEEALATDAEVLLLDNMDDATLASCVARARAVRPVLLEASGNMTPDRIREIRHLGLDFVSAGGLVHQARWVDLSMKVRSLESGVRSE